MAVKHVINVEAQRHEMVLKCTKDSVEEQFPREQDGSFTIGKGKETTINKDLYRNRY